jgi:serine/threonine protein kinase
VACGGANTLGALVAGALPEAARAAIANHAAACDRCHALIEGLVETGASSATSRASDEMPTSGDGNATGSLVLRCGTRVGRYVIDKPLGAGGMGVVYAAIDSDLHRRVAVKLLRPDLHHQGGSDGRDRLMREARSLARLSHPNVVTVFDVGEHRGQLFIAMELVDGGSLSAWLRRAPRATDEIIDRLLGAGRGLAASHAAGVVHCDVKPDNILIGLDGRARMTDFGLAHRAAAPPATAGTASATMLGSKRTGTFAGTPAYMAPEQLMRGETDARSDQWSFCATLYEALAGVRPFAVEDITARLSAIAESRLAAPAPGHRVPGWVRQIVTRGLRADPSARWPSMDAMANTLALERRRRPARCLSSHS